MPFCNRVSKEKSSGFPVTSKPLRKRPSVKAPGSAGITGTGGMAGNGGMLLGYARVSKGDEQNNALQAKALKAAGCRKLFEEAASRHAGPNGR